MPNVDEPQRGALAAIPASVRYDTELRPNGKLLYGEIMALACDAGYCWAENAYLGDRYGLSAKTVEALLRQLEQRGYIRKDVERDEKTQEVLRRKIWPIAPLGTGLPPPLKNEGTSPQNRGDLPSKSRVLYKVDREILNNPPNPPGGEAVDKAKKLSRYALAEDAKPVLRAYVGQDEELARVLADFIAHREEVKAINSKRAITAMLHELDSLSGGRREDKLALLNHAMASGWKSVYPIRGQGATSTAVSEVNYGDR